ncbi:probable calcium-binding protein CML45 [Impatiens glandulifera]|uniref:probable calcium-binding protein CML45 n=1 Tax=Impatiens glandulifera TaxID=253017 RepID=UPI001FB09F31|nr:probable calcium-binding protein CML45 [Impatiens glandulifera]
MAGLISYFCFANLPSLEIDIAPLCYFTFCMAQFIFCRIIFRTQDCFCPSGICSLSEDSDFRHVINDKDGFELDSTKQKQKQIYREEVEMVMGKLGIDCVCDPAEREVEAYVRDDFLKLLEEKEPSLEEMKEAFDVFDVKRDGFIDAEELQRVICSLGFGINGGLEDQLDNCRRMIRVWDFNGDGMIDLNEFIKLMEAAFS